jgi:hypothetical protein
MLFAYAFQNSKFNMQSVDQVTCFCLESNEGTSGLVGSTIHANQAPSNISGTINMLIGICLKKWKMIWISFT